MLKKASLFILLFFALAPLAHSSCSTLDITDEYVGAFYVGVPVSWQMQACCGTAPYTFTTYSGSLPPGLSMSSSGLITGTPTTAGESFWCVTVTDAAGCHLTRCYFIDVF